MNLRLLAEPFPADCIEWKIGTCGLKKDGHVWAKALAYIQARAIMDRLDSVCGPENWRVSYEFVTGGVLAHLSIKYSNEWVTKTDGAEPTDYEPFKGGISSALKRAGSVWGIGRYLYGLEAEFAEISETFKDGFQYGKTKEGKAFYWKPPALPSWALPAGTPKVESSPAASSPPKRKVIIEEITTLLDKMNMPTSDISEWIYADYKKNSSKEMTDQELTHFLESLKKEYAGR